MMRTRCPACQTVFRIGDEQLRARRGAVRCGHCFHPFNALEHEVVDPAKAKAAPASAAPPAPALTAAATAPTAVAPAAAQATPAAKPAAAVAPAVTRSTRSASIDRFGLDTPAIDLPDFDAPDFDAPDFDALDFVVPDFVPPPAATPAVPTAPPPAPAAPPAASAPPPRPEVIRSSRRSALAAETADAPPEPASAFADAEFDDEVVAYIHDADTAAEPPAAIARTPVAEVRAAHVKFEPRDLDTNYGPRKAPPSALRRTLAAVGIGLLGSVLAMQTIYLYRMEIARDFPGLRPLLERACAPLGCIVPLPRDIDRILIDASELQSEPGRPGSYVLHVTVNNNADYPQAWPQLELTLTDGGDSALARRVLTPTEWAPEATNTPAFPAHRVIAARIPFSSTLPTPTGYRVYVFYP